MRPAPIAKALDRCRERLAIAARQVAGVETKADTLAILGDIERSIGSLGTTIGFERRKIVLRKRASREI